MTDNYMVTLDDISKDIKVGNKATFNGACGVKIDKIEIFVDGFKIGEAKILTGAGPITWNSWTLEYSFTNGGHRSLLLTAKSKGEVVLNRFQKFDVASEVVVKPNESTGKKFPVTIIESKIQHTVRWNMDLKGLIVHFTASNAAAKPYDVISDGNTAEPDLTYWVMDYNGDVYKTHELNEGGYHCASEEHRWSLGIEVMTPGKLSERNEKLYYWYDARRENAPEYPREKARYFKQQPTQFLNGKTVGPQTGGWYVPYTDAQEKALVGLVQYLKDNCKNFSIDRVLGHDEVLPDYRDDPGGSLSMSMKDFREYLKKVIV
jgi:hypothetical protein